MFEEKDFNEYNFDNDKISCVYMFLKDNKVLYVGKANDIKTRMQDHKMLDKKFDKLVFKTCKPNESLKLEDYYMLKYNPKHNLKYNSYRKSLNLLIKELLDLGYDYLEIANTIKECDPNITMFHNKKTIIKEEYLLIKEKLKK